MRRSLVLGLLLPVIAQAGEIVIECPSSLVVSATVQAPAGWRALDASKPHVLSGIGMFSGPPEEGASLVPVTTSQGRESKDSWSFGREVPEGLWVACYYVSTTSALVQKIEPAVTRCEARHQTLRNGTRIKVLGMRCQ